MNVTVVEVDAGDQMQVWVRCFVTILSDLSPRCFSQLAVVSYVGSVFRLVV